MIEPPAAAPDAVAALYGDVRGYVRKRVAGCDADDVTQDVFERLHRRLADGERPRHLRGWVFAVTRSVVADHFRRAGRAAPPPEPEAPARDAEAVEHEVASWLPVMLETLPPADREALTLVEIEGLSQVEAARRLGLSPSGFRTRVQRARARLRATLEACCAIDRDRRGGVVDYRCEGGC